MEFIGFQHAVQKGFLLLDLLNKNNHGLIVGGHNMAQSHLVDGHGSLVDLCQAALGIHVVVGDGGGAGVYISDIYDGQYV